MDGGLAFSHETFAQRPGFFYSRGEVRAAGENRDAHYKSPRMEGPATVQTSTATTTAARSRALAGRHWPTRMFAMISKRSYPHIPANSVGKPGRDKHQCDLPSGRNDQNFAGWIGALGARRFFCSTAGGPSRGRFGGGGASHRIRSTPSVFLRGFAKALGVPAAPFSSTIFHEGGAPPRAGGGETAANHRRRALRRAPSGPNTHPSRRRLARPSLISTRISAMGWWPNAELGGPPPAGVWRNRRPSMR